MWSGCSSIFKIVATIGYFVTFCLVLWAISLLFQGKTAGALTVITAAGTLGYVFGMQFQDGADFLDKHVEREALKSYDSKNWSKYAGKLKDIPKLDD